MLKKLLLGLVFAVSISGVCDASAFLGSYNDYEERIMKGQVAGHTIMSAMGEFESGNVNASGEDACRTEDVSGPARLLMPSALGEQMTVVSDDVDDDGDPVDTGVRTIRIHYLDASGDEQTEDITLNGTTAVDTVATDIRFVNDMYSLTVGSTGVSEGNIALYKKGGSIGTDLYNLIAKGGNKSLVPHRMVPNNKTLYLQAWHCLQATQGKRAAYKIRSTDMYGVLIEGVFCFKDVAYIGQASSGRLDLHSTPVPSFSVVKISHWSDTAGTEGSCSWWGILVDN